MASQRPHIVFVHVDQMHAGAVSALGNKHVQTPNIDRILTDGYAFLSNYATMPQCCPARASWYTGLMSKEHGVVVNGCPIRPDIPDLGQWLREHAGYDCVYTGKWHVSGRNVAKSFEVLLSSGLGELNDSALADSAIAYLRNRTDEGKPFFLNIGFMNPHDCCYTAGANGGVGKFGLAGRMADRLPPLPANFVRNPDYAGRTAGWRDEEWRYYIYCYYRLVEMVDAQVGRVYDALQRSPHRDNTLFIFTADHGDGLGFHGKVSKGFLEEEAWRVPAAVVLPGRVQAGVRDQRHLTIGVDITATICDYAGAPPMPNMTIGRSWRPLLEGRKTDWRDHLIGETSIGRVSTGVRDARFKTIFYIDGQSKVYDLERDPLEMKNLVDSEQGRAIEVRHRQLFAQYIDRINLCPVPTWGEVPKGRQRLYEDYLRWYASVREGR